MPKEPKATTAAVIKTEPKRKWIKPRSDRRRQFSRDTLAFLIPNAITTMALCMGLSAVRFALMGKWELAITSILVAGFLDGVDGRVARMMGGASQFGAEFDSLSDFISFGVAPALILYLHTLQQWGNAGWGIVLFFSTCMAFRLARFNTMQVEGKEKPQWMASYATGVQAPAAAMLGLFPFFVELAFDINLTHQPIVFGFFALLSAFLMISNIPTFSMKNIKMSQRASRLLLVGIAIAIVALLSNPWVTIGALIMTYSLSIPFSFVMFHRKRRADANQAAE